MKTVALLSLLIAVVALMGCTADPCDPCGKCGCLQGNCCGWEFYKPCHAVGRRDCEDVDPCGTQIVLKGCETMAPDSAEPEAPAAEDVVEEAPVVSEEPAVDPVADYGQPPAVR